MRVNELYSTVQGEGRLTGTPSVLVRLSGCPLRCGYCDTSHASWDAEGEDRSTESIVEQVERFPIRHVVLTGGEPMLYDDLPELTDALAERGYHITIETSGVLFQPVRCDLMSISPKLSNSRPTGLQPPHWLARHESRRHRPEVIRQLIAEYDYQLKFVIGNEADCHEVEAYLDELDLCESDRVWMMPEGTELETLADRARWLVPYCDTRSFHYCPRKHIEWFGQTRGT